MGILISFPNLLHKRRGFADIADEGANEGAYAKLIMIAVDQQHEICLSL